MKKIIYTLIKNRKIAIAFVIVLVVAGVLSFIENPKQESPDFSIPYAMITAVYPGASQSDVDLYVTEPIVNVLKTIEGYKGSNAYSSNNLSLVLIELEFSADIDEAFSQINEELALLQSSLPEECRQIEINTDITNTPGILLGLSSDTMTNQEIIDQADSIKSELSNIEGFKQFEIYGNIDMFISVKVDDTKMKSVGLSFSSITELIEAGNYDFPIGEVTEKEDLITVNYSGGYDNIDDVSNLEIGYSPELQKIIRLKDIAEISLETTASNTYYTLNGSEAVIIAGYFDEGINILPLKEEIEEKLDSIESDLAADLETTLIISQPAEVDDSLKDFSRNLILAVVLVILVVLLGMGLRNAVVVSISLPLSVLISFGVMYISGIKIHQISIAALIVCLGMLVDNSIVVSDSIQGYLDDGIERKKACMLGVKAVAAPVFASTITTVAVFLPFLFLNSIAGDYIKSLPQIVSISLAASYLTAILIIPIVGFSIFKPRKKQSKKKSLKLYKKILKGSMNNKILVLITVIILVSVSVFVALNLDTIFFPAADKNIIYIDIRNNNSNNIASTIDIVNDITIILDEEAGIVEYVTSAGGGLPRFNKIMSVYAQTPDVGQIMLRVDLEQTSYESNEEYKSALQEKIDSLNLQGKITVKELMYAFPMDEDLKIRIIGDDLDQLKIYERQVIEILKETEGIINIGSGNTDYVDEYKMLVLNEEAIMNGLQAAQIQNEISIALLGRQASTIRKDGYEIKVIVSGDYSTYDDLSEIPIQNIQGNYITANEVTSITKAKTISTIPRYNGDFSMTLTADYDLAYDKQEILEEVKDKIDILEIDNGNIIYEGEDSLIKDNFGQVGVLGLIALAIVFLILMVQFKSLTLPLIIFVTIPLSTVGSVLGLYITGQPISFTALLGIVSLLGIVVNNAIILLDYIKKEELRGIKTQKACINASIRRLRPILLSTITTIIGLIPLAISSSDLFKPMAIALMSGLLVSTLLTLIVLPVLVSTVRKVKPE